MSYALHSRKDSPPPIGPRLFEFGIRVTQIADRLPRTPGARNVAAQLARAAMSPASNYAEARGAESRRDFAHKLSICLKELREIAVWLAAARRLEYIREDLDEVVGECDELTAIMVSSVRKLKGKADR
jgi:four helix bundle protein